MGLPARNQEETTMGKVAKVGILACAVLMLSRSSALAQVAVITNEGLLNGRYSFGAHGNRPGSVSLMSGQISRVGTLRFDGIGHVLAARFVETADGLRMAYGGPSNEGYRFVGGEYTVQNNGLGRIALHFETVVNPFGIPSQSSVVSRQSPVVSHKSNVKSPKELSEADVAGALRARRRRQFSTGSAR
jgi:hypothetical protein